MLLDQPKRFSFPQPPPSTPPVLSCCCLLSPQEVLDFQVDKQARLNQLPATVSLRRHQLALLDTARSQATAAAPTAAARGTGADGGASQAAAAAGGAADGLCLQGDLSEVLVFSSLQLERLKHRMQVCGIRQRHRLCSATVAAIGQA